MTRVKHALLALATVRRSSNEDARIDIVQLDNELRWAFQPAPADALLGACRRAVAAAVYASPYQPVVAHRGTYTENLAFLRQLAESGSLVPAIGTTHSLKGIAEPHRLVDTKRKVGSAVIAIRADSLL